MSKKVIEQRVKLLEKYADEELAKSKRASSSMMDAKTEEAARHLSTRYRETFYGASLLRDIARLWSEET